MRSITCLLVLLTVSLCAKNAAAYDACTPCDIGTGPEVASIQFLLGPRCKYTPIENYIEFYCVKSGGNTYQELSSNATIDEVTASIDLTKPTVFATHGYTDRGDIKKLNEWLPKTGLLAAQSNQFNYCIINYQKLSKCKYSQVVGEIYDAISDDTVDFINRLVSYGSSLDRTILLGHSIGAHLAGIIGSKLGGKATGPQKIIALDPAQLEYYTPNGTAIVDASRRIDPTDGKYVVGLHVDTAFFGSIAIVGDSDYFVDKDVTVPGCPLGSGIIAAGCRHTRSTLINYASTNPSNLFYGYDCNTAEPTNEIFGLFGDSTYNGTLCLNSTKCYPYTTTTTALNTLQLSSIN